MSLRPDPISRSATIVARLPQGLSNAQLTDEPDVFNTPLTGRRLAVLRDMHRATHDALLAALPDLRDALTSAADVAALTDLLAQVATESAESALALAERLGAEPAAVADLTGLRKWALYGLQRHRNDAPQRLHFFQYEDPLLFGDQCTETDSAHLLSHRETLQHYLDGFGATGFQIELHEPQPAALAPPAVAVDAKCADGVVRFPRRSAGVAADQRSVLYRAAAAHAAAHLRHSRLAQPAGNRRPMLLALIGLVEDARVEHLMANEFPGLRALWGRFHTACKQSAGFEFAGLTARLARALHDPSYLDANEWVDGGRQMFNDAVATNPDDAAAFEKIGRQLAIGIEKMRLSMPPSFRIQPCYRDDNALLWDHNPTVADDERTSVEIQNVELRTVAELPPEPQQIEVDFRLRTRHPEWDCRLDALREDWTTVIEPALRERQPSAVASAAVRHRKTGQQRTPDRSVRLTRLAEGDELDLNAAVANAIDQRAHAVPDGRIFRRHGRRRRSSAVLVLMDLSESTGRFVPGSFVTVLEVEKRAARAVAEALDCATDRVALHGFSSNGRHEVHYQHIKDFDEPFGSASQARLSNLQGHLSTRMGAAVRHASTLLARQTADHKVIVMLTDGEPSDVDALEEDYLVEDARHAVTTAAALGIRTFCLTLDRHADDYVRRIFGARNYLIADRAANFAGYTGQTLMKLIAQ